MARKTITYVCNNCGWIAVVTDEEEKLHDSMVCVDCGKGFMFDKYGAASQEVQEVVSVEVGNIQDSFCLICNTAPCSCHKTLGRKNDSGKLRFDLISPLWEEGLAEIMTGAPGVGGAGEYGARNWEQGLLVSRVYAAHRRHINAWIKGEDNDPKSGKSHLFHANACLMFLWAMPQIHPELDDRVAIRITP